MTGRCACSAVRYRLTSAPMFVHCCHCLNCQRQTGSAFVINLLIEADRVEVTGDLDGYYDASKLWPAASLERLRAVRSGRGA